MTFPQAPLGTKIGLQLTSDGPWTDITTYTLQRAGTSPPVQITRGRPNETSTVNTGSCQMQWKNTDGRFTPGNPTGPYYGQIGRNTPVRVSVPDQQTYLRLEDDAASVCQAPSSAGLNITGDIDIRIDFRLTHYTGCILAGKWTPGTQQSWLIQPNPEGTVTFFWSTNGSNFPSATLTGAVLPLGRYVLRITLAVATGTVTFWTAAAGNADTGPFTQLGSTVVTGATSIFSSTSAVSVGNYPSGVTSTNGANGQIFEFELRSGIAGTVEGHPVFTSQTEGATSFTDAQSNTWTLSGTAELSKRSYRFHGECASLPVQWDSTGNDVWTPVQAGGIFRRIQQGNAPVQSPVKRAILNLSGSIAPVAYWTLEDPAGAAQFAPSIGGVPMLISEGSTPSVLATDSTFVCSSPLPQVGSSAWTATVPAAASWTDNVVRFLLYAPAGTIPNNSTIAQFTTTGTVARVALTYSTASGGSLELVGFDASGTNLFTSGFAAFGTDGQLNRVSMNLKFNGAGSISWEIEVYQVGATSAGTVSGTVSGTISSVTSVKVNPIGQALGATVIGHLSVQAKWDSLFDVEDNIAADGTLTGPLRAWQGEQAGLRFLRLCKENSIQPRIWGWAKTTVPMGTQAIDTLSNLLQACEDADHGMQYEPRQCLGLGYRTLRSLCNQSALSLSYTAATLGDGMQGIGVTYDDLYTVNDWTITNSGGGTTEATLNDGSLMSITAPPTGAGDYTSSKTLNLQRDAQLADAASWMLHVSTVNEPRYPAIPLHLGRTELASQFYAIQNAEIGDYVAITSPPAWLPPGNIKQLIAGTREQLGGFHWLISWQCIPESPYEVLQYDSGMHFDTDGSTLSSSVTSAATSLSVATTSTGSPLWTTSAGDFPFTIVIDGEVITVTNCTGSSSPQTMTVTRSTNGVVKAHNSGAAIHVYPTPVWALT